MRYVIIGSCIAAMGAVEGIRSSDRDGSITLIDGEQKGAYSRPLISYYLTQPYKHKDISYRSPQFLAAQGAEVIKGMAVQINRSSQEVLLDNGKVIPYDRLLIATGGSPVIPDIPGVDASWVQTFYTLADVEALNASLVEGQEAVIIGSGLIGMKAAESLWQRGLKVSIIEKEDHILPRILNPGAAAIISNLLDGAGIEILCSQELTAVKSDQQVEFASGLRLPADLVILALGTRPRTGLARECGLAVNRGIVAAQNMQTSDANIYAAGDVVESINLLTGENEVMALLPLAHKQGYAAGCNMAGGSLVYPGGIFQNSVNILGTSICSAGSLTNPGCVFLKWRQDDKYLELSLDGAYLSKYIAINMPLVSGPLTNAIEKRIALEEDAWSLFIKAPTLSAIPAAYWQQIRG